MSTDNRKVTIYQKVRKFTANMEWDVCKPIDGWWSCRDRGIFDAVEAKVCDTDSPIWDSLREVLDGQS